MLGEQEGERVELKVSFVSVEVSPLNTFEKFPDFTAIKSLHVRYSKKPQMAYTVIFLTYAVHLNLNLNT